MAHMTTAEFIGMMKKKDSNTLTKNDLHKLNPQLKNNKAFISNELITAIFHKKGSFTAIQLLMYIASRDESNTLKKGDYYQIEIDLNYFAEIHKTTKTTLYKHLDNIQTTLITLFKNDEGTLWDKVSLIARQEKLTRSIIRVDMHENIYKMIKEKEKNFSVLTASNYQNNLSFNTLRVLMLCGLIDNQDTKRKEFTLEELNFMFDTNYTRLQDFDRSVFQKAKAELDNNSNLTFESEKLETLELSRGRPKLRAIRITITKSNHYQGKLL